jgi:ATP-dependent Clp protease adaptor protein ClpS
MAKSDTDESGNVAVENKTEKRSTEKTAEKLEVPAMYKVVLLNDDFTPMDFVVLVLKKFFKKNDPEANQIMLKVHQEGKGVAGTYSYEVAEMKVDQVNVYSRRHRHPLKTVLEEE